MWPFNKKEKVSELFTPKPVHLRIGVILLVEDFNNNFSRVKEVADKLEPIVHMLRTKQRELARLKILSLKKGNTMSEENQAADSAPAEQPAEQTGADTTSGETAAE